LAWNDKAREEATKTKQWQAERAREAKLREANRKPPERKLPPGLNEKQPPRGDAKPQLRPRSRNSKQRGSKPTSKRAGLNHQLASPPPGSELEAASRMEVASPGSGRSITTDSAGRPTCVHPHTSIADGR
jgi:hypothetical protein